MSYEPLCNTDEEKRQQILDVSMYKSTRAQERRFATRHKHYHLTPKSTPQVIVNSCHHLLLAVSQIHTSTLRADIRRQMSKRLIIFDSI